MGGWEELSDWYDKKMGETGDLWHRALIDPVLIRLVGVVKERDVLDLGCGNGYLARKFARQGGRVKAIDSSPQMIKNAIAHDPTNELGIKYLHLESNHLDHLKDESFDIVFANMTLMDMEDAEGAIREVGRVLRKDGIFVASISHPCFDNGKNSGWLLEKTLFQTTVYRRIRAYRKPFSEDIPWGVSPTEKKWTVSYHRPLNWYATALRSAGLQITALEEPGPTQEFLEKDNEGAWFLEVPLHLAFSAVRSAT